MDGNKKPKVNPDYTVDEFSDEILLYTKNGTRAVYLNETAYAVWQLCKEDTTVNHIIAYLEDTYPDQADQIRRDVIAALKILESNDLIEWP